MKRIFLILGLIGGIQVSGRVAGECSGPATYGTGYDSACIYDGHVLTNRWVYWTATDPKCKGVSAFFKTPEANSWLQSLPGSDYAAPACVEDTYGTSCFRQTGRAYIKIGDDGKVTPSGQADQYHRGYCILVLQPTSDEEKSCKSC